MRKHYSHIFQILSDLHLENIERFIYSSHPNFSYLLSKKWISTDKKIYTHPIKARYLILAGDIGNPKQKNYKEYMAYCANNYEKVFVITGNHEYHSHLSIDKTNELILDIILKYSNICFLDNSVYTFEDSFQLIGSTLWTPISTKLSNYDSKKIPHFSNKKRNQLYSQNSKWLMKSVVQSPHPSIIISHHLPSKSLIMPQFKSSQYSSLYASNIWEDFHYYGNSINSIKHWIYGHTHQPSYDLKKIVNIHPVFVGNPLGTVFKKNAEEIERCFEFTFNISSDSVIDSNCVPK
jgi:predicted phosphodiesterase